MLFEEFKTCVPAPIKTYLEEHKVIELQRAAGLADEYKLTHRTSTTLSDSKIVKTGSTTDLTHTDQRKIPSKHFGPTYP